MEGNWTYSGPDIPRSHWIEQGHDEDYAEEAENLIQSIKRTTKDLRSDCSEEVCVGGSGNLPDDALNPHWEQLANAMLLSECIKGLDLDNVQLNARSLQMIEASVRQKGVTYFFLANNQFLGGEGVQLAANVLKSNRSVRAFGWNNSFRSTEDACKLVDAVLDHPKIHRLALTNSFSEGIVPYTPVKRLFGGAPGTHHQYIWQRYYNEWRQMHS